MSPPRAVPLRAPEREAFERAANASPHAGGAFCLWRYAGCAERAPLPSVVRYKSVKIETAGG